MSLFFVVYDTNILKKHISCSPEHVNKIAHNTGLDKNKLFERKIVNIFLSASFKFCFGCSKDPSHWEGSFEYPQHKFFVEKLEM